MEELRLQDVDGLVHCASQVNKGAVSERLAVPDGTAGRAEVTLSNSTALAIPTQAATGMMYSNWW